MDFGYPIFFLLFTVFVFVFVGVVVAIVVVTYICNIAFTRYLVMESQARTDAGKPGNPLEIAVPGSCNNLQDNFLTRGVPKQISTMPWRKKKWVLTAPWVCE